MKFSKLSIHGFKSFIDKTVIDFHEGITGIVGPNGSGKSNIMDAVLWVLGEKSAKELRGDKMDDVISYGSASRKPAGFAEVGLTFSDVDEAVASKYGTFSELTITRKYYRDGDNKYYINSRPCRRKDVLDIFMDTGLGARSISIIPQNKVSRIMEASPEELRYFLEETAGVVKFKENKKESERRLEQTKENLARVADLIDEKSKLMEALSEQVKKLEEFKKLEKLYYEARQIYYSTAYLQKSNQYNEIYGKRKIKASLVGELNTQHAALTNKETGLNYTHAEKQKEYTEFLNEKSAKKERQNKVESEILILKNKLETSDTTKASLSKMIEDESARLSAFSLELENISNQFEEADKSVQDITSLYTSQFSELNTFRDKKEELESSKKKKQSDALMMTSTLSNKRNEHIRIESAISNGKTQQERLEREVMELSSNLERVSKDIDALKKAIEESTREDKEIYEDFKAFKEEFNTIRNNLTDLNSQITQVSAEINAKKANIDFLETQIELLSLSNNSKSFDIMSFLKHYSAKLLIEKLHDIDKMNLVEVGDVFLFEDEFKSEVIDKLSKAETAMRFTFRSDIALIREGLLNINIIGKALYNHNGIYKKVGSDDKSSQILNMKESLERSKKELEELNSNLATLNERVPLLEEELASAQKELNIKRANNERSNKQLTELKAQLNPLEKDFSKLSNNKNTVEKELAILNDNSKTNIERLEKLKEEIDELAAKLRTSEEEIEALEKELEETSVALEEKRAECAETNTEKVRRTELKNLLSRERSSKESQFTSSKRFVDDKSAELKKLLDEDEIEWKTDLNTKEYELNVLTKEVLSLEEATEVKMKALNEIADEIASIRDELNKLFGKINSENAEINSMDVEMAGLSSSMQEYSNQYLEQYGATLSDDYLIYADKERDIIKTQNEAINLNKQIEKLGNVNMVAAEQYEKVHEEWTFLSKQRADIEEARNEVQRYIEDIDSATAKMFEETFNALKEKFVEVFHILFGNGEAGLKLTDPSDILHSGVEIFLQPPGKRVLNMSLFSGGEKALAAMTLIFAIFLYKPTPFCFLDEIDAPLDDANVDKYKKIVQMLSDRTQFIITTHKTSTMAIADYLYGITMQEAGVTSVLSVDLKSSFSDIITE